MVDQQKLVVGAEHGDEGAELPRKRLVIFCLLIEWLLSFCDKVVPLLSAVQDDRLEEGFVNIWDHAEGLSLAVVLERLDVLALDEECFQH